MTRTAVKICGLRSVDAVDAAIDAGADYVGLVFFPPSPRNLALPEAEALARHIGGRVKVVALMVDPDDRLAEDVVRAIDPDLVQLHGSETPDRVAAIKAHLGVRAMKALKVATAADVAEARAYAGVADLLLFDARPPEGAVLPGGNGVPFDWHILEGIDDDIDYMLSGGLTPENVAEAIRLTGARAVDVSSGVESAPGVKDPDRIRAFVASVRAA